jgi:hypothetical protein
LRERRAAGAASRGPRERPLLGLAAASPAPRRPPEHRSARRVYLQVEADNAAALAFYARRGCFVAHSYHYRSA